MYQISNSKPLDGSSKGGKWEIIELYDERIKDLFKLNMIQKICKYRQSIRIS